MPVVTEPGTKPRFSASRVSVQATGYIGVDLVVAELKNYKWRNRKGHLMGGREFKSKAYTFDLERNKEESCDRGMMCLKRIIDTK